MLYTLICITHTHHDSTTCCSFLISCRAFGLWLDGELDRGSTATCAAFNNAPLTGNGEVDFKSAAVEVFYCSNS